ncbi:MAG: SRPBCC family protein [Pseudonocardiaceae bacterium]
MTGVGRGPGLSSGPRLERGRQARMGMIHVCAERVVDASAGTVYGYLADMREHHPRFLPSAFSAFEVETGGVGEGTIARFTVIAGGRSREYRMMVSGPEPGRVLTESDTVWCLVTTFTVTSRGATSRVRICTTWQGAAGIGGLFAPRAMHRIYADELDRLNTDVCGQMNRHA